MIEVRSETRKPWCRPNHTEETTISLEWGTQTIVLAQNVCSKTAYKLAINILKARIRKLERMLEKLND